MAKVNPSAGAGSLRLNLNPKWPFWINTPKPALPVSAAPQEEPLRVLPVVVDFAVDRAASY